MTSGIHINISDGVLTITLDRPAKKNALTGRMYETMTAALVDASAQTTIRAVLIHGAGGMFTAGNDLEDFLGGPDGAAPALSFIRALADFEKPIVAAVEGQAVGVGTTMLFHCDLVYAAPDARFTMPFVDLGLVPEAASTLLTPIRLGYAKAAAMLLLGEPLDAAGADTAGLVTSIVSADVLLQHSREKAKSLAMKPAEALLATRRLMKASSDAVINRIDQEAELFEIALRSAEAREAINAFLQRRALAPTRD